MIESTAKYVVAKYVPDLERMEPRNIGVIVWSPEGVAARFVAEKADNPGVVDGRSAPSWVTSLPAYRQWIQFWRSELDRSEIKPPRGSSSVAKSSPDFLEALKASSGGNFLLADGGVLLDPVRGEDLPELSQQLFSLLVYRAQAEEAREGDEDLDSVCDHLISDSRLDRDPHFSSDYPVRCLINGSVTEEFRFSHAYTNGTVGRLYQRVPLPLGRVALRRTIDASAWMFDKVAEAGVADRERCAALVYVPEERAAVPQIERSLEVLGSVARILNVRDAEIALEEFKSLSEAGLASRPA